MRGRIPPEMRESAVQIQSWILDGSGMLVPVESFTGSVGQTGFVHGALTVTINHRTVFPGREVEWIDHVWSVLASEAFQVLAGETVRSCFPLQSLRYDLVPMGSG